jgi:DNA-dependent RNA polymerase auxiliary subunit epsilon
MYVIISDQMVIILYIEFVQSALMYYCKRKMYFAVNLYSDDVVVDVVTIRENRNFHSRFFFLKKAGRYMRSHIATAQGNEVEINAERKSLDTESYNIEFTKIGQRVTIVNLHL